MSPCSTWLPTQEGATQRETMSRGGSFGGGQSSLGYLFDPIEEPNLHRGSKESTKKPQSTPSIDGKVKALEQTNDEAPKQADDKAISNNYHRAQGQNVGNFITNRPSTKVHLAPGGSSYLGYLFGDK